MMVSLVVPCWITWLAFFFKMNFSLGASRQMRNYISSEDNPIAEKPYFPLILEKNHLSLIMLSKFVANSRLPTLGCPNVNSLTLSPVLYPVIDRNYKKPVY